jgi:hypothetical protein
MVDFVVWFGQDIGDLYYCKSLDSAKGRAFAYKDFGDSL